jgi:nucleoside-diphosphate-sugar epimerase
MSLHTILGANGTIATELIRVLQANAQQIRLVSRNPKEVPGAEVFQADMLIRDQVFQAVKGSEIVYLLVGLEYNRKVWKSDWPVIMRNTIDACKAAAAKLIFFDNVYMYGRVRGPMTESSPYNPSSVKGKIRAEIDEMLLKEMNAGSLKAAIATSADFYGPRTGKTSVASIMIFDKMKNGKSAQWFVNAKQPHSFTYTPDAALALYMLAMNDRSYGQIWHLPTAKPALTGTEFIAIAAKYMHAKEKVQILPKWLTSVIGIFVPIMRELGEMLYQYQFAYEFDSSKFEKAFQFKPTPYETGIKQTAEWYTTIVS